MFENSSKGYQEEEEAAVAKQQEESNGMKIEKLIRNKELGGSRRKWSSSLTRNPRIVRVAQTLGGKDRHSKVYTIRGLRDRRIRLSVPTAIQLYDLQHKLGLSQPSKVVDWLLDVTKSDIDKLPPLDQYFLSHNNNYQQQQTLVLPPPQPAAAGTSFSLGAGNHHHHHQNLMAKSILLDNSSRLKGKEVDHIIEKGNYYWWWMKTNDQEENHHHHKLFSNSSISTDAAITTTYNNSCYNIMEYPSSTLSLSQFGGHATSSSSSLFTHQHAFPFMSNSSMGISDPRQICNNHVHQFFSSSQLLMPGGHAFNIPPLGRHPITLPFSSKLLDSNHTGSSDH